ncbi:MAG: chorismate mutase [Defluviitaleaceae bacterium]|nr:chorismate mutase [Defluviitaleaceae bacterium]
MRAIRGAICAENTKESILKNTTELLREIFEANDLDNGQVISITFAVTRDLDAVFPAVAARDLGLTSASLLCLQSMDVVGALPKCIRVEVLADINLAQSQVKHIYLGGAEVLRPDLVEGAK